MKKIVLLLILALGAVACDKESPSEPRPNRDSFDTYELSVQVNHEDSTRGIAGARGLAIDMFTAKSEQFRTDDIGRSDTLSWGKDDPRKAGVRLIVEPGSAGGLSYDEFDRILFPQCVESDSDSSHGICRLVIELVNDGIG